MVVLWSGDVYSYDRTVTAEAQDLESDLQKCLKMLSKAKKEIPFWDPAKTPQKRFREILHLADQVQTVSKQVADTLGKNKGKSI